MLHWILQGGERPGHGLPRLFRAAQPYSYRPGSPRKPCSFNTCDLPCDPPWGRIDFQTKSRIYLELTLRMPATYPGEPTISPRRNYRRLQPQLTFVHGSYPMIPAGVHAAYPTNTCHLPCAYPVIPAAYPGASNPRETAKSP